MLAKGKLLPLYTSRYRGFVGGLLSNELEIIFFED